jgi:UDP-glucose 4-epimerase
VAEKRILVTGGAGFVGSNLCRALIKDGHRVYVFDDLSTGMRSNVEDLENCELITASLEDAEKVERSVMKSDYIVHLGARGSVPRSIKNPAATFKVNIQGTINLMEAARKHETPLFFSSSSSVYGTNKELPKHETMWTHPMTPYAASKLAGESIVGSYGETYGLSVMVMRFFNIFGPYQRPNHEYAAVIPKWIWKAMNNEVLEVYGDGEQSRDFTFVADVVEVIRKVIVEGITSTHPINLAFGVRITLNEVLDELKKYFPNLKVNYLKPRPGDVRDSQNSPKLLRSLFPDLNAKSFEVAFRDTVLWLDKNVSEITRSPQVVD